MSPQPETPRREFELPRELEEQQRRAVRLEWITIAYMLSAVVLLFLTLGQSQAMKAAWIEDLLSLLPPAAFLIASRLRKRDPSEKFPWGMHRAVTVAYVFAALALLVMGGYVFLDSAIKLVRAEHPPIGVIQLFGEEIWLGWVMIAALVYSGLPAVFLGRAKLRLADDLHDKVLYADAQMNKADWMTVTAAIVGIFGIGFGLWWADAVAALFISVDIVHDGWRNVRAAVHDLMDARPRRHDAREYHPIVERMNAEVNGCDWVERGAVRLREEGHVFTGEVMVVPRDAALADGAGLMEQARGPGRAPALARVEGVRHRGGAGEGDRHPVARGRAVTRRRSGLVALRVPVGVLLPRRGEAQGSSMRPKPLARRGVSAGDQAHPRQGGVGRPYTCGLQTATHGLVLRLLSVTRGAPAAAAISDARPRRRGTGAGGGGAHGGSPRSSGARGCGRRGCRARHGSSL